jgi:threonine dehydrogenase-like Zn-dependent dehydrogenase
MNFIKTKVYKLLAPQELVLIEEQINVDNLGDNEFIAETIYTAISPGTETAAFLGKEPLRPGNIYPRVVGYCNIAKVIVKGKSINDISIGDFVLTFQSHRSHYVQSSKAFYLKVNPELAKKATVAYLFHLGYHSLLTAGAKQGHNIAIIGAGVLGVATSIMSEVSGARTYLFSNQIDSISIMAKNNKFVCVLKKQDSSLKIIQNQTEDTGIDIIVNTSNSWEDWKFALNAVNTNGLIVNLGFPGRGEELPLFNPLNPQFVYTKNLTIKALSPLYEAEISASQIRFNIKRNLEYILSLIKADRIFIDSLVTNEISYPDLNEQYIKYTSRNNHLLSTLILWKE